MWNQAGKNQTGSKQENAETVRKQGLLPEQRRTGQVENGGVTPKNKAGKSGKELKQTGNAHEAGTEIRPHTGVLDWLVPDARTSHRCGRLS